MPSAAEAQVVFAAYGWDDLLDKLQHGFYPTKQGERFTIHPDARAEILARFHALNHQRYAEEVAAGLHDNGKAKPSPPRPRPMRGRGCSRTSERVSDASLSSSSWYATPYSS